MTSTTAFKHGLNGYTNFACRCDICRIASTESQRNARLRRKAANPEANADLLHGRSATYENHGCRCQACTAAHRDYNNAWNRRRNAP